MRSASQRPTTTALAFRRALVAIVAAFIFAVYPVATAFATTLEDQIKALEQEVAGYQAEAGRLRSEADTLKNAIAALDAQQAALQTQIEQKELQLEQLKEKIKETELRIREQQQAMGSNLRAMYFEGEITPLEQVFSSKSIGDFIDKQAYRNSIRESIKQALIQINQLKTELEKQKTDAEHVLADQKAMRDQLTAQEKEKNTILAQTQGQEQAYQSIVGQKNSEIESLRAQQRAANLRWAGGSVNFGPACAGGYPGVWCNAPMDSMVDDWGMYNRECVSYTAFKVASSGRHMPFWGGVGNANQWDDNARAEGISVDGNPRAGDVAILHLGQYGHAMYVEAVNGDGTISVSEYNLDWTGRYSERVVSTSGLVFIHF